MLILLREYKLAQEEWEYLLPVLLVRWIGPYRVKEVGEYSVFLEHLITHEVREAHTSPVEMYAESNFEVTEEILDQASEQGMVLKVQSIAGHKFVQDVTDFMLKVLWRGFEAIEASWEPLKKLMEECPAVVMKYVEGVNNADLAKAIKQASKREALEDAKAGPVCQDMAWGGGCCVQWRQPYPAAYRWGL
ncbi:hypothetical protein H310_03909 [Aphanomyces invadans]|uniref:Chromo domain-containing protein n=1 Tax=Aphanomyces invadans TaxID=157072 RepID=A0A024UEC6_9STRA|nr:hypothetical protein H310_03909 [Aphanomyces invadans]ETW04761.1 hypothetical protein H310_03909 [Aphanomyces invadans]|eukprot:XP_008866199.1 hypothetical protein H310_03909 [Aphanomyces invadans]